MIFYLERSQDEDYVSKEVKKSLSPRMDIQLSSNFERLIY
jgi:hypothetical protein